MRAVLENSKLDDANIRLGQELLRIKSSLDVYRIIGFNSKVINAEPGTAFFFLAQDLSLRAVLLGLSKIFERSKKYQLCSIPGIFALARKLMILNNRPMAEFITKYQVNPSSDWQHDINQVLDKQRTCFCDALQRIERLRNKGIAHLELTTDRSEFGPAFDALEKLLEFAFDFHSVIHQCFVGGAVAPIAKDVRIENSLKRVLKELLKCSIKDSW